MTATDANPVQDGGLSSPIIRRLRRDLPFFAVALGVLALDQLTKSLVRNGLAIGESWPSESWLVKITHVTNSGAAFGILQGQGVFLTITAFVAIGAIAFYYAFPPLEHGLLRLALGLQLGGAVGNLLDRLRFGEVTDMFHFPHYPAFNIADSSIVVGLVAIGAFLLFGPALTGKPKEPEPQADAD
ncbi:MAG: signal peptidase II [Dehalococcoidia bacterium]|nr:signal peptidase II [Dehalococcoidia bacterium]